jgi:type I restriction enzyme M protein
MSSNQSGEGEIRRAIIEADLVDCMVTLPGQLFYTTPIAVCLWFLAKNKRPAKMYDRRKKTLFIDARALGHIEDRKYRVLSGDDISRIVGTYQSWRGKPDARPYSDVPGFCASVTTEEIARHDYKLAPGPYVGAEELEVDEVSFGGKMEALIAELSAQRKESAELDLKVREALNTIGYDV